MESRPRLSTITSVTTHVIIRIVHIHFHRSHPSTLKYLHSTQTDNERPQSTIKDITAKSNNRQDLGNKIRYLKSQASYVSVLSRKLKQGLYYSRINYFRTQKLLVPKFWDLKSLSVQIMSFQANLNWSDCTTFLTFLLIQTTLWQRPNWATRGFVWWFKSIDTPVSKKRKISRYKMETVKLFVWQIGHLQIEGGKNNKLLRKKENMQKCCCRRS